MKKQLLPILFTLLLSLVGTKAFAYDIKVENADGVTIYYNYINDGKDLEVTYKSESYKCYSGSVVIPDEVSYMNRTRKVTSIGNFAFNFCSELTSVTIPNSVTRIRYYAFQDCSGLTSVTIPNSVTSIEWGAFANCYGLTSITIPNSVTSIGDDAFYDCYSLTSITIPNSVTSIGNYAFRNCYSLTSITIPNSVTSIGEFAFERCSGLTSITIPNSVTSIGEFAFYECSGLTSITIPNRVTSIEERAFYQCSGLISVTIPNSVKSIGEAAFGFCSSLTSLTIGRSVKSIGEKAFDGCDNLTSVISLIKKPFKIEGKTSKEKAFHLDVFNNATLYVPVGTFDKYKATEGWKDFLFIEEGTGPTGDVTNSVASVRARSVLIQNSGNMLTASGVDEDTTISVFDMAGRPAGSAKALSEATNINTSLRSGDIGIVKIDNKAVKVLMK